MKTLEIVVGFKWKIESLFLGNATHRWTMFEPSVPNHPHSWIYLAGLKKRSILVLLSARGGVSPYLTSFSTHRCHYSYKIPSITAVLFRALNTISSSLVEKFCCLDIYFQPSSLILSWVEPLVQWQSERPSPPSKSRNVRKRLHRSLTFVPNGLSQSKAFVYFSCSILLCMDEQLLFIS